MIARIRSLAETPSGSAPSTLTAIVFGLICGSVWVASTGSTSLVPLPNARGPSAPWGGGGEPGLALAGADAERERAERAVGRGVRVAADDRHARLGERELRADDVHDALPGVAHREQLDAELGRVLAQRLHLGAGDRVGDRAIRAGQRDPGAGDAGGG